MTIFYSEKTGGFYDSSKVSLDKIPSDAKKYISVEAPVEVIAEAPVAEVEVIAEDLPVEVKKSASKKSAPKDL